MSAFFWTGSCNRRKEEEEEDNDFSMVDGGTQKGW
jgi:hypothetical protein